jgi:hypothetical protein
MTTVWSPCCECLFHQKITLGYVAWKFKIDHRLILHLHIYLSIHLASVLIVWNGTISQNPNYSNMLFPCQNDATIYYSTYFFNISQTPTKWQPYWKAATSLQFTERRKLYKGMFVRMLQPCNLNHSILSHNAEEFLNQYFQYDHHHLSIFPCH